jgi:hypothetical protein
MLIGTGFVLFLLALLDVNGIGWPELLVAVAPMVGGIVMRTGWWVLLYPTVLGAGLVVAEGESVQHVFNTTTMSSSVQTMTVSASDRLNGALMTMDDFICDDLNMRPAPDPIPRPGLSCEMMREDSERQTRVNERLGQEVEQQANRYAAGTVTEWSIVALTALWATFGTVIGKIVANRIAQP